MENRPAMVDIMQILEDSLTAEGIEQWLRAANRLLGGRRPIDLIDEGDTESVRQAAQAFLDGAYV
jgi:broad specificity phosphatase PhoE